MDLHAVANVPSEDKYLVSRGAAWFAFAMTVGLMVFDYVDRQVIVSLFPHLKAEWGLSDKQLGALVSIVSITVAIGGIPVALIADRVSRVKSIVAMAAAWSLATISCMFASGYGALFAARAVVGLGEAGYGSVGAGLIASHFPARMRGTLMAGFFASASVGSVLGVILGGVIADRWGWKAAFGVVGIPGLALALLYLFVRDYKTVELTPRLEQARQSAGSVARHIVRVLTRSRTMLWVCIGAPAQLIVVSSVWAWMPSFLVRTQGMTPQAAGIKASLVVLAGAVGSVVWGAVVDRVGRRGPGAKLRAVAMLCLATLVVICFAFGAPRLGIALSGNAQFALILLGGLLMTCTVGPAAAAVIDVTHPGVRSTGASILSLFQNLFGLALGPIITGAISDSIGLEAALTFAPLFGLIAVAAFLRAATTYQLDTARSAEATTAPAGATARSALA
ncbi:MAG TPA: MFS transporter [Caldimonas sp.]|nr:MFS transporter [Caldimonas sp.]HEX4233365.1 MFS transporter [Caldimonas sp.]